MTMDAFRYRSRARIVAIVDLILSSMSLCLTMILVLGAVIFATSPIDWGQAFDDDEEINMIAVKQREQVKKVVVGVIWAVVIFSGITTIVEIIAAIKLLNATQLGQSPLGAMKLCIFWRRVCIAFTVLLVIGDIFFFRFHKDATPVLSIVQVLLRVIAIYLVSQFIKELNTALSTGVLPLHSQAGTGGAPLIAGVAYSYIPPVQTQQQAFQQQPPYNPDYNAAPPSYYEVVKDPPPKFNVDDGTTQNNSTLASTGP